MDHDPNRKAQTRNLPEGNKNTIMTVFRCDNTPGARQLIGEAFTQVYGFKGIKIDYHLESGNGRVSELTSSRVRD